MDRSPTTAVGGKDVGEQGVTDYQDPAGESELRRRAARLLGILVLVAAILVTLMVLFLNSGGGAPSPNGIKPLPTAPTTPTGTPPPSAHRQHSKATGTPNTSAPGTTHPTHHTTHRVKVPPRVHNRRVNCPGASPCIARGDIGNAVAAINAYRVQHGAPAVSGAVTRAAQICAVTNGGRCPVHWAETQVPTATGAAAVRKIASLMDLLDHKVASLQVGWAYDPAGHEYFIAVIRHYS
jgi:hypothetical protein